jgi:hypothetical protein
VAESAVLTRMDMGVAAELLDEFSVSAHDPIAALDAGFARGNPRRRLLVGSKGRFGVAVHGCPPCQATGERIVAGRSTVCRQTFSAAVLTVYARQRDIGGMSTVTRRVSSRAGAPPSPRALPSFNRVVPDSVNRAR